MMKFNAKRPENLQDITIPIWYLNFENEELQIQFQDNHTSKAPHKTMNMPNSDLQIDTRTKKSLVGTLDHIFGCVCPSP